MQSVVLRTKHEEDTHTRSRTYTRASTGKHTHVHMCASGRVICNCLQQQSKRAVLTILQPHDVHGVEGIDEREPQVEPRAVCLALGLQLVFAPRVLLVRSPRMPEGCHHGFLLRIGWTCKRSRLQKFLSPNVVHVKIIEQKKSSTVWIVAVNSPEKGSPFTPCEF